MIADPGSTPEHFLREVSALVLGTGAGYRVVVSPG